MYTAASIADWKQVAASGTGDRRSEWNGLLSDANRYLTYQPTAPGSTWGYGRRDQLRNDAKSALNLAIAYAVTGDQTFATSARRILLAWSEITTFKSGNPDWRLDFVFHHLSLVYAAGLIRTSSVWSDSDESTFRAYLLRASKYTTDDRVNNWADWGMAHETSIGQYLGGTDGAALMDKNLAQMKKLIGVCQRQAKTDHLSARRFQLAVATLPQ